MDRVAWRVGGGFPPRSNKDVDAREHLKSIVQAVPLFLPLIFKTCLDWNAFYTVMIFAAASLRVISAQQSFTVDTTSYNCSSNIICLGDAHVYNGNDSRIQVGRLSLVSDPSRPETVGVAYYNQQVRFLDPSTRQSTSFNTSFTIDTTYGYYNATKPEIAGDGMVFVISADNKGTGATGSYFGFFDADGITQFKSIVVEFDTFYDGFSPFDDISANHVSFDFMNITWAAAANASSVDVDLSYSGLTIYAWVEYSSETKQLEVRVSNSDRRPTSPLLNYTVDLFDVSDEYMWVGFASGTGDIYSNYYIGEWTFESYGILASAPAPSPPPTLASSPGLSDRGKSSTSQLGIIVGISVAVPAFLLVCVAIALCVRKRSGDRGQLLDLGPTMPDGPMIPFAGMQKLPFAGMPKQFSYKQLSLATGGFSKESTLGQGGFGSVYRGVLPESGVPVAVKRISGNSKQGEKEFITEVFIISQLRHRNLIQILGWCKDSTGPEKFLLVYELMPNGSLDKALYGPADSQKAILSWKQRFNIVAGIAAALDYLHQGWNQQIIHRDVKSSNIMLDEDWNAKLGDFGLARLVDHEKEAATTLMAGTYGYIAPEVAATGKFTEKTDVFAFGAVVLEAACGRKALSGTVPEDEMILVDWVWHHRSMGDVMSTVDKRLEEYDPYWMEILLIVGLQCSHPDPLLRPPMRRVVQVLSGDAPVPSIPESNPAAATGLQSSYGLNVHDDSSKHGSSFKSRSGSASLISSRISDAPRESPMMSFETSLISV